MDEYKLLMEDKKRLTRENNELHQMMIKREDTFKQQSLQYVDQIRLLSQQNQSLLYTNQQLELRNQEMEHSVEEVKERLENYMSKTNVWFSHSGTSNKETDSAYRRERIESSFSEYLKQLEIQPFQSSLKTQMLDVMKMTEIQNDQLRNENETLKKTVSHLKESKIDVLTQENDRLLREIDRLTKLVNERGGKTVDVIKSEREYSNSVNTIQNLTEQIEFLQQQLDTARDISAEHERFEQLQKENKDMKQQLTIITKERNELMRDLGETKRSFIDLNKHNRQHEEIVQSLKDKLNQSQQILYQKEGDVSKLTTLSKHLSSRIEVLQQEIEKLNNRSHEKLVNEQEFKVKISNLEKTILDQDNHLNNLRNIIKEIDSNKDAMSTELDEKDERLSFLEKKNSELGKELLEIKTKSNQIELGIQQQLQQLKEKDRLLTNQKEQLEIIQKEYTKLKNDFEFKSKEIEHAGEDLKQITGENQFLHTQLNKTVEEMDKMKQKLEEKFSVCIDMEHRLKIKDREFEDIMFNYKSLNRDHLALKDKFEELSRELGDSRTRLELKTNEMAHLSSRAKNLDDENQHLIMKLKSSQQQIDQLSDQLHSKSIALVEFDKEKEKMLKNLSTAQHVVIDLQDMNSNMRRQTGILQAENEHLKLQLNDTLSKNNQLSKSLTMEQQKRSPDLEKKIFDMEQEFKQMRRKIEEKEQQLLTESETQTRLRQREKNLKHEIQRLQVLLQQMDMDRERIQDELNTFYRGTK